MMPAFMRSLLEDSLFDGHAKMPAALKRAAHDPVAYRKCTTEIAPPSSFTSRIVSAFWRIRLTFASACLCFDEQQRAALDLGPADNGRVGCSLSHR